MVQEVGCGFTWQSVCFYGWMHLALGADKMLLERPWKGLVSGVGEKHVVESITKANEKGRFTGTGQSSQTIVSATPVLHPSQAQAIPRKKPCS